MCWYFSFPTLLSLNNLPADLTINARPDINWKENDQMKKQYLQTLYTVL